MGRSKEVEDAIKELNKADNYLGDIGDFSVEIKTLLNYISELEEIVNSIDTQFIHKDKVYEIVDELNKSIDSYNDAVDKFNILLGKRTRR